MTMQIIDYFRSNTTSACFAFVGIFLGIKMMGFILTLLADDPDPYTQRRSGKLFAAVLPFCCVLAICGLMTMVFAGCSVAEKAYHEVSGVYHSATTTVTSVSNAAQNVITDADSLIGNAEAMFHLLETR